jgi:hypothetical protein
MHHLTALLLVTPTLSINYLILLSSRADLLSVPFSGYEARINYYKRKQRKLTNRCPMTFDEQNNI